MVYESVEEGGSVIDACQRAIDHHFDKLWNVLQQSTSTHVSTNCSVYERREQVVS